MYVEFLPEEITCIAGEKTLNLEEKKEDCKTFFGNNKACRRK
jgi:hypothetical protein